MLNDVVALFNTIRPYAPLALILFGPRVLSLVRSLRNSAPSDPLSPTLLILLALQTVYAVYSIIRPPYDVFTSHALPTLVPSRALAERVVLAAGYTSLPEPGTGDPIADLLARLTTKSGRETYVRWGHAVAVNCGWCRAKEDWAVAALPGILGPYALQAALIGAMGWQWLAGPRAGRRAARYRLMAGAGVVIACAGELAARWWTDLRVENGQIFHLSSFLHSLRQAVLLLLTAFYVLAPVRTPEPVAVQEQLASALESTAAMNRLTSAVRGAVVRDADLLRTATQGEVAFARAEDRAFADSAEELKASGYTRQAGRTGARMWLDSIWVTKSTAPPTTPAPTVLRPGTTVSVEAGREEGKE